MSTSLRYLYILFLSILVLLSTVPFHLAPDNFLADDAYFYPQIARQIILGHGSTFHQITQTNGYHPLWLFHFLPAAWLSQDHPLLLLNMMGALQTLLYGLCLYFLYLLSKKLELRFFSIAVLFLTFVLLNVGGLRLFEAHLSIACQAIALYMFFAILTENRTDRFILGFGVMLGMILLARSDNIFFAAALWIAAAVHIGREQKSSGRLKKWICLTIPPLLFGSLFLVYNYLNFGHFTPISGAIKSTFPNAHFSLNALGAHGKVVVVTALVLLGTVFLGNYRKNKVVESLSLLLGIAIACHAGYIALFSWGSQWYYTTAFLAIPFSLMILLTDIDNLLGRQSLTLARFFSFSINACVACLLCLSLLVSYLKTYYDFSVVLAITGGQSLSQSAAKNPGKAAAELLGQTLKSGEGVFVFDSPGVLAYYTDLRILPADGLVNDYAYNEEIVKRGIQAYLREHNVRYVFGPYLENQTSFGSSTLRFTKMEDYQMAEVKAPLTGMTAGSFMLSNDDIVVKIPTPLRNLNTGDYVPTWAVWKIPEK